MTEIEVGNKLGKKTSFLLSTRDNPYIVCSSEDADFFARGVLEGIESSGLRIRGLACYWNDIVPPDVGSVVNKHVEPCHDNVALVVAQYRIETDKHIKRNLADLKEILAAKIKRVLIVSTLLQTLCRKSLQRDLKSLFDCEVKIVSSSNDSTDLETIKSFPEIVSDRREYFQLLDTIEDLTRSLDFNYTLLGDDRDIARKLFSKFSRKFMGRRIPIVKIKEYTKEAHSHINGCINLIRRHFDKFANVNKNDTMAVVEKYLLTYLIHKG